MSAGYHPILSLLTEMKNALLSGKSSFSVSYSRYRESVLKALAAEGFLTVKVFKEKDGPFKRLQIEFSGEGDSTRRLMEFKALSRSGRRYYLPASRLKDFLRKRRSGVLVTTSRGVLTIKEAVKKNLGGEVLFEV